jgi:uncharacterized protein
MSILQPTQTNERIQSLDFLRGFAILGILIMNVQSFSMPGAAYMNPTAYGDLQGANYWVWILSHIFGDQKFMTIFSILYGAGIILVTQRAEERTGSSSGLHYRRTFWLLIIGLIHAHIIWYGDILVHYAICALLVYLFRKMKPGNLLVIGICLIAVHTILYTFFGMSISNWPPEALEGAKTGWIPGQSEINLEISKVTGTWAEQVAHNSQSALFLETLVFLILFLWRAGGLMLIGMALYKMGVLTAKRTTRYYRNGMLVSFLIGFPIVIFGVYKNFQAEWSFEYSMYIGSQFNYWGSIFVSFGYICGIMLVAKSQLYPWLRDRFAAVGQMALTNYIAQSIICTIIFFGIGFGLFGQIERSGQVLVILALWIVQIAWSRPWLNRFKFGPLEWIWRSLTYWKKQPMGKERK